jgi:ribosomal protein S18 acetylase RimI-like enzyme
MPTPMPLPSYRLARREDIPALIALFEQLAPEMPVHGVPRDQIHKWATSGNSSVALLGPSRELVGFVLGDLRRHGSPLVPGGEPQPHGISLFHAGVAPERRGQGIFSMMISVLQRRGRPLFGNVHTGNKFQVRHRLLRLGFHYVGRARAPLSFDAYRWIPG